MANTIKLKRGTSTPSTSDISSGEVAIDTSAQKLYINDSGTVKEIGGAGTTINNNANNRIITGSGTANTLEAESSLTWDGQHLKNSSGNLLLEANGASSRMELTSDTTLQLESAGQSKIATTAGYIVLDSAQMIKINSEQATEIQVPTLHVKNQADTETVAKFVANGGCELYYDDSKKLHTTSSGATITGTCTATAFSGDGSALTGISAGIPNAGNTVSTNFVLDRTGQMQFKSDSYFETQAVLVEFKNVADNATVAAFYEDSRCELYYDGTLRFKTTSTGSEVNGALTTGPLTASGTSNSSITASGTNSNITLTSSGTNSNINLYSTGSSAQLKLEANNTDNSGFTYIDADTGVRLFHGGGFSSQKLATTSSGVTVTGTITPSSHLLFGDGIAAKFGASNDLEIEHTGSNSTITDSGTGKLVLKSNNQIELIAANNESMIEAVVDGATKFYYDNSKKAETVTGGFTITGTATADTISGLSGDHTLTSSGSNSTLSLNSTGTNSKVKLKASGSNGSIQMTAVSDIKFYSGTDFQTQTFEAKSGGVDVYGNCLIRSGGELRLGDDDNSNRVGFKAPSTVSSDQIWTLPAADGSANTSLTTDGSGNLSWASATDSTKLSLTGGTLTGTLNISSSNKLRFGDSAELQINHLGGNSFIEHTLSTGTFYLQGDTLKLTNTNRDETFIACNDDGNVELYYDNSKKFETTSGGVTLHNDVLFDNGTNANKDILFDASANKLEFSDDVIASFGNGSDLQVYHNGTHSFIANSTGQLQIKGDHIELLGNTAAEYLIRAIKDGAVELYYDNSKKFETNTNGVKVTGQCEISSHAAWPDFTSGYVGKAVFGSGDDLQIYHNGSTDKSIIYHSHASGILSIAADHLNLADYGNEHPFITCDRDGAVALYYDNSKKIESAGGGVNITGDAYFLTDNGSAYFGASNDLRIYHDGSNSYITNSTGNLELKSTGAINLKVNNGTEYAFSADSNGATELYYDNSKKFETNTEGVRISGYLEMLDSQRIQMGTGDDLQIFHDGTNSHINNYTGIFKFGSSSGGIEFNTSDGHAGIHINDNDSVELYFNNGIRLNTSSSGATCHGSLSETSDIALKEDIEVLSNSLTNLKQLNGYSYKFKETGIKSLGLTAQEVEKVFPDLVEGKEGEKSLHYSGLIAPILEAIKELSIEVETLKNKVTALEAS